MFKSEYLALVKSLVGAEKLAGDVVPRAQRLLQAWYGSDEFHRGARRQAFQSVLSAGQHVDALVALYSGASLAKEGWQGYRFLWAGAERATTVVGIAAELTATRSLIAPKEQWTIDYDVPAPAAITDASIAYGLAEAEYWQLRLWNQPLYRLRSYSIGSSGLTGRWSLDQFARFRFGIGTLWNELLAGIVDCGGDIGSLVAQAHERLPLRISLLPDASAVAKYSQRMCAVGIALAVAMRRAGQHEDYVIPIQRRAPMVSGGQSLLSLVPQAYHQPLIDAEEEAQLGTTCLREVFEELFGGEEVIDNQTRRRHDWYLAEHPAMKWLQDHRNSWDLVCTGFGFDLATGNYEAALLLRISDPCFFEDYRGLLAPNWEGERSSDVHSYSAVPASKAPLPLVSTRGGRRLAEVLLRRGWTGVGLFAFSRALTVLRELEPDLCDYDALQA